MTSSRTYATNFVLDKLEKELGWEIEHGYKQSLMDELEALIDRVQDEWECDQCSDKTVIVRLRTRANRCETCGATGYLMTRNSSGLHCTTGCVRSENK